MQQIEPQQCIALRVPDESSLAPETAQSLTAAFAPFFAKAEALRTRAMAITVTSIGQVKEIKDARTTRLALKDIRVAAEKTRKSLKEDSLRKGKAIDGVYNILEYAIRPLEEHLEAQEKFAERLEQERKNALAADRSRQLQVYGVDPSLYDLGAMAEATFVQLLETNRLAHESRQEAQRKAEAERIVREQAEAAERERMRAENERLKKEADAREAVLRAERVKAEAEAKAAADQARKEREALEAKAKAEREVAEAAAKVEREAREKAEAELRARAEAEARAKAEQEEAARKAAAAPDKQKLADFAKMLHTMPMPGLTTSAAMRVGVDLGLRLNNLAKWLDEQVSKM